MFPTLKLGYIDGYCVGEPWTSVAIDAGAGVCVATSADLAPLHPEKVLMVRRDFAEERASEHERMAAALLEACAFCEQPKNHPLLAEMLSQPHYVNAPPECFKTSAVRPVDSGIGAPAAKGLNIFHRHNANDPTDEKAEWLVGRLYELMEHSVLQPPASGRTPIVKNIFRRDIFQRAKAAVFKQTQALQVEAERSFSNQ
jgi:ABC-type nitrate/sulfonate/bicarbonate transport system substrate-binding protein